jgi:hypothetical protein
MTRWSSIEKNVGQLSAKWPREGEIAQTSYWTALRESVESLRGVMYTLDDRFESIEGDDTLSEHGKTQARAALATAALVELKEYKPQKKAANTVARRIENLKERINAPSAPTSPAEIALASEIRALVRAQGDEAERFVFSHRSDPKMVAAVTSAPAFLSGLSDESAARIKAVAAQALFPNEMKEIADLEAAEKVTRQAVQHARERIAARGNIKPE